MAQYDPYTLLTAAKKLGYKRAQIDKYVFWLNPTDFSLRTAPIYINQPTRDGIGRFSYNMEPYLYTIRGFTGNSGAEGLNSSSVGMQQFRPIFGRSNKVSRFTFPYRNLYNRRVYLDFFEDTMTANDNPFLFFYNIQFEELPPTQSATQRSLGPNAYVSAAVPVANGVRRGY